MHGARQICMISFFILLAVVLTAGSMAVAQGPPEHVPDHVTVQDGTVRIDADTGEACVVVPSGCVSPVNLPGLLRAGRVKDGDSVRVLTVTDRGKHRGHVTVLK